MLKAYIIAGCLGAAVAVMGASVVYQLGRSHGGAEVREEIAKDTRKRLNNAQIADDAHNRCLADPACRVSNDGFRRD